MNKIKRFRKIENTRAAGAKYHLSMDEIREYSKCSSDIFYFIENYLKINLRQFQKEKIGHYLNDTFLIDLSSRQMGNDLIFACICLWKFHFKYKHTVSVMDLKPACLSGSYDMLIHLYKKIPYFLQSGIVKLEKDKMILFENGSQISYRAYSKDGVVETNANVFLMKNFAHAKNIKSYLKYYVPTVSALKNCSLIVHSQPNGFNEFYKLVTNCERKEGDPKKNFFKCIKTYWWEMSERDYYWKSEMIRNLGSEELFDEEFDIQFLNK